MRGSLIAVLLILGAFCDGAPARSEQRIDSTQVVEAAQFAMAHLRNLSDSGVYESLELRRIKSAQTQEGVFHFNTYLGLELASPHFKSGRPTEEFHLIVMRSKADGSVSFAIDDFPEMREDAIETYWINKVERHRMERERAFAELRKVGKVWPGRAPPQQPPIAPLAAAL